MKLDRYTKALLTVIALALTVLALRPLIAPSPSYAARKIEYRLAGAGEWNQMLAALNRLGADGWEVAAMGEAARPGQSGDIILKR